MTAQTAPKPAPAPQTPPLPQTKPQSLGLSAVRLHKLSDAFKRDIDKGTIPGVTMMVARRGQIGWFEALGRQNPAAAAPMALNSIFRIFSMTKPIVSVGIMTLLEEGYLLLNDPVAKYIPEFSSQTVGVENNGKLDLVPLTRPITVQDLLRHTSGITYDHTGNSLVQQLYQQSRLRSRKISNAEHAAMVASLPLMCQPGAEWNYSRSTDILGRIIEVVSGKTLSTFLTERILAPLQMAETGFHTGPENTNRLAEPFVADPWNGEKVQLFNMLEQPVMESGGGGLVSTSMDYARFCQMLLNGGTLDGNRIIGHKTLQLMASRPSRPQGQGRKPADAAGPWFWARLRGPHPAGHGAVRRLGRPVLLERDGRNVLLDRSKGRAVYGVHVAGTRPARIFPHAVPQPGLCGGGMTFGVPRTQRNILMCAADPGSMLHRTPSWVPAPRSSTKGAAPRPGHEFS
jgi:CubicO group peptidase (beta-lactamase class C family)